MINRQILLVEDNADDELLTLRALRNAKVANDIRVARDGAEALEFLFGTEGRASSNPTPQLILLDLKLPKVSGIEILQAIKNNDRTRRIPVVILTSSTEEIDRKNGYDFGANSFVSKPVNFYEFAEAVQQLGCYWLLLNQLAED
jgi:two-component system response regulator